MHCNCFRKKRCRCENDCGYSFDVYYEQNTYIKSNSAPKFHAHTSTRDSADLSVPLKRVSQLFLAHTRWETQHDKL